MAGPNLAGYSLAFDDEFNGTAVDTSKWTNLFPWGDDHLAGETERYQTFSQSPGTYTVANGALTITAAPASNGTYTSGRISSQNDSFSFQPGTYIEAREQLPGNTGAWPAFWTAAKDQTWPPEFDDQEWVKSLGTHSMNFGQVSNVWNSSDMHGGPDNVPFDVTAGYHTYGVQWTTNNQMIEYIDGQQMATGNVPADWFDSSGNAIPQYVEANLAVGSNKSPADWAGPPDGSTMKFNIDYIRGFAVTGTQAAVTPQAAPSPDGGGLDYYGADNAPGASSAAAAAPASAPATAAAPAPAAATTPTPTPTPTQNQPSTAAAAPAPTPAPSSTPGSTSTSTQSQPTSTPAVSSSTQAQNQTPPSSPTSTPTSGSSTNGVPHYDHVVVVVEENRTPSDIKANAPYIDSLISKGAVLTNETADGHPSQPNYLDLYAGSTFGVTDDNAHNLSGPTLATQLSSAGKSFVGYVDGTQGVDQWPQHEPWTSFGDKVQQPMSAFPSDFTKLPDVSFVIPSYNNDMHDGTVAQGDAWLQQNLGSYASWAQTHNSLLIVTTDEDDGSGNNNVLTVMDGANVVPGSYGNAATPVTLDSTIAAAVGVTPPGPAGSVSPLTSMFAATSSAPASSPATPPSTAPASASTPTPTAAPPASASTQNQTATGTTTPSPSQAASGTHDDTLVLHLSEDPFQGDAQAQVFIDGTKFGSPIIVTASHASGQTQEVDLPIGNVASGSHSIDVEYLNNLFVDVTHDRNLYADPIQIGTSSPSGIMNPKTYGSGEQALYMTGDMASFKNVLVQHA